jgi:hypothetical protein
MVSDRRAVQCIGNVLEFYEAVRAAVGKGEGVVLQGLSCFAEDL